MRANRIWAYLAAAALLPASTSLAAAQSLEAQYHALPAEVRHYVEDVRKSCVELEPQSKPDDILQGIDSIELGGASALFVDAENLCKSRMAGANCNNRGCDLKIWKRSGPQSWRKVFDKNLFRKFISVTDEGQFKFMVVTIYAGDPHCHPKPGKFYTSGQGCDAMVHYRKDRFDWQVIH